MNVGTGSLDRARWAPVVDAFIDAMAAQRLDGRPLDVRENVRFKGANVAAWTHERYPGRGCAPAIEFKKIFMDEWTGEPERAQVEQLAAALAATVEPVTRALERLHASAAPPRGDGREDGARHDDGATTTATP